MNITMGKISQTQKDKHHVFPYDQNLGEGMLGMEPRFVTWTMDFSMGSISVDLEKKEKKLKTRSL